MQTLTTKQLAQACGAAHATRLPTPLHVTYPRSDIEPKHMSAGVLAQIMSEHAHQLTG